MKKTILATAIMLASAGAFATGGSGGDFASAAITGVGAVSSSAATSASATGNNFSYQGAASSARNTLTINANSYTTPTTAGVSLSAAGSGSTSASVFGVGTGTSAAFSAQGDVVHGSGNARVSDFDLATRGEYCDKDIAGGIAGAQGRIELGGAQGSFAKAYNIDSGEAAQYSGAGFDNYANLDLAADVNAHAGNRASTLNVSVDAEAGGTGYSYVVGTATNAFGMGGAGYIQGSMAKGKGGGVVGEYSADRYNGEYDLAIVGGTVNAKAKQGSAGGVLNIGDGNAFNATMTKSVQSASLEGRARTDFVDNKDVEHGARAVLVTTTTSESIAESVKGTLGESVVVVGNYESAIGATDAKAYGNANAEGLKYTISIAGPGEDCYSCDPQVQILKGNNGLGDGPDGTPPGLIKNGGKGAKTDHDEV